MRSICFYFQVHQPFRLTNYRFFDIGSNHYYFDEYRNKYILRRIADKCYLPMNQLLYDLIQEYGSAFKVSFSLSGTVIDQFERYTPDVLESFIRLAETGCVEFIGETYSHSLSALKSKDEFFRQVAAQNEKVEKYFKKKPTTFRNTELIYSDGIGEMVAEMGYKTMLTEGAKHVLGWKSPNYMYCNAINPKLKMLLKNFMLSDDIAFRFSQTSWDAWPLTTEKYVDWLNSVDQAQQTVNLFMDYETFGEHQWPETGIFEFMKALPGRVFANSNYSFNTPAELSEKLQPVAAIHVPHPISWADEERDLTAWLGNELQDDAFNKLYDLEHRVAKAQDEKIQQDWKYLQTSDHFYYMCTKWFSDGDVHKYFNPYNTPYEAYINFMNVLSDFVIRLDDMQPVKYVEKAEEAKEKPAKKVAVKKAAAPKAKKEVVKKTAIKKAKSEAIDFKSIATLNKTQSRELLKSVSIETIYNALFDADARFRKSIILLMSKTQFKEYSKLSDAQIKVSAAAITKAQKQMLGVMKKLGK